MAGLLVSSRGFPDFISRFDRRRSPGRSRNAALDGREAEHLDDLRLPKGGWPLRLEGDLAEPDTLRGKPWLSGRQGSRSRVEGDNRAEKS